MMKLETIQIEQIRPNAANIRTVEDDDRIERLAGDIKTMGVQNPLRVYPDPDVEGDYRLQDGHRRRLAAIRAGLSEVPCIVVDEPQTHELGDLDVMMTTGRNHKLLLVSEEAQAFQTMLDLGRSETTIAKKFKQPRSAVLAKARVTKAPEAIQEKYAAGQVSLDALIELQKVEDLGDSELTAQVHEHLGGTRWALDRDGMIRLIGNARGKIARQREVEQLEAVGAKRGQSDIVYDGRHKQVREELSDEEHAAAGHKFLVYDAGDVGEVETKWFAPASGPKTVLTEAEKERKNLLRALRQQLPVSAEVRHRHYVDHVLDRKAGTEAADMDMLWDLLKRQVHSLPEEILVEVSGIPTDWEGPRWDSYAQYEQWSARVDRKIRAMHWNQIIRLATLGEYWDRAERRLKKPEGWEIRGEFQHMQAKWREKVGSWFGHEWDSVEQQAMGVWEPETEPSSGADDGEDEAADDDAA